MTKKEIRVTFKKEILIFMTVVMMLVALPGPPVSGTQVVVAPIVEKMARAFQGMKTMRAAMNQQKTYGQLGMSDPVEHGALYIKRKNDRDILVRLEISKPAQRVITVKDNQFMFFQPSIKQAIEGHVQKAIGSNQTGAGILSLFVSGPSQVTKDYQISTLGDETVHGRRATHLRLVPYASRKGLYRQIDLWVDNNLYMPTQQRLVEANQDVTLVQLSNVEVNVSISDALFTQKLPNGVQRVRG
jgi:outer membrane lipoprotein-sorting protein